MYDIDELILYGNTGVCRVEKIGTKDLPEARSGQLYYTLRPLHQPGVIYTPVDSGKVFMRPIVTRTEAERLIDTIPTIKAEAYHNSVLSELSAHYETYLKTYDCGHLIKLTMSLYAKKQLVLEQKRKFGAIDDRFMRRAEDLLFGELSAALNIPKKDIPEYITSRVGTEMG